MYKISTQTAMYLQQDGCLSISPSLLRDIDEDYEPKRIENLEFHIKLNDYFGNIATILDLIHQEMDELHGRHSRILKNLSNDLHYLQQKYIVKKK